MKHFVYLLFVLTRVFSNLFSSSFARLYAHSHGGIAVDTNPSRLFITQSIFIHPRRHDYFIYAKFNQRITVAFERHSAVAERMAGNYFAHALDYSHAVETRIFG